jgi:hypothetical protein
MAQSDLSVVLGTAGIVVSVLLAVVPSRVGLLAAGLIVGVLLTPLIKRAAAWLAKYLGS